MEKIKDIYLTVRCSNQLSYCGIDKYNYSNSENQSIRNEVISQPNHSETLIQTKSEKAFKDYCSLPFHVEPIVEAKQDEWNTISVLTLKSNPGPDESAFKVHRLLATAAEVFEWHYGHARHYGDPEGWLDDNDYIAYSNAHRNEMEEVPE